MNTWESQAYQYSHGGHMDTQTALFYPGIYSRDAYNMLAILAEIQDRPNPQIELGPVDMSCPMILCDLTQPDQPIVYANDSFCYMTGYCLEEVKGKNCRFLQAPGGRVKAKSTRQYIDKDTVRKMRKAIEKRNEIQVEVTNFKKNGQMFINILTMIPVMVDGRAHCVGFQCEKE